MITFGNYAPDTLSALQFPSKLPCLGGWFMYTGTIQQYTEKLDGVGPLITDPPPTSSTTLSVFCFVVTHDTWRVTRDTWHVTRDMWHMTHRGWWTLCQSFRSLALTVWKLWWFEDISTKDRWLNQSINQWITEVYVEQPRLHRVC